MNSSDKAYFYAGLSVLFWSTVATSFKIALRELDPVQLIFYASAVTLVILFLFLLIQGKINLLFRQSKKEIISSLLLGALNPLLYYIVLFRAYSLLPAQMAQPLNLIWPLVLALLSVPLLRQKIGSRSIAGLLISFAGVVFISSQGSLSGFRETNFTGVALALFSSVIWSLYWILTVRDKRDETVKLFLNFFFGLIYLTAAMFLFSDFRVKPGTGLYAAVYIGIFETGITYIFWLNALKFSTNNAKTANLIFLVPFISLIFIRFILKETIFVTTFIGLAFIVAGIFTQRLDRKKQN